MTTPPAASALASHEDLELVRALRAGDERVFAQLVDRYQSSLVRLAATFVGSRAVAEEVAQDTWLGVIKGIDRFEGRSTLKTWIFRILTNTAKTRAQREGRSIPFSALSADDSSEPSVDPDRFLDQSHPTWAGHWNAYPRSWDEIPDNKLVSKETRELIERTIEDLPDGQRLVVRLRDVEGFTSEEVCDVLGISDGNQRVLLHRARSKIRAALESYLEEQV